MKFTRHYVIAITLLLFGSGFSAHACTGNELSFNFQNLKVLKAFAIFADFANLQPDFDQTISYSSPMKFDCTPWDVAAQNLADQYNLKLTIKDGTMRVTR